MGPDFPGDTVQTTVTTQYLRRAEVTYDEFTKWARQQGLLNKQKSLPNEKSLNLKEGFVNLKVVLSGCSSLDPSQSTVRGKEGESSDALLKRTRLIADSGQCSKDLKVEQEPVDLKVALSGCNSLEPSDLVLRGTAGESPEALLKRARLIAGQANCSANNLKVEQEIKPEILISDMSPWMQGEFCRESNSQGDDYPIVCVTQEEADAFCKSEGATLPPEALIENAMKGPSGTDIYGNPIASAAVKENIDK
ncbi:MAG TPA: hypothetical protein DF383_05535, partial [Deltaproteobacteria bacterium]|nr:hypothetical protein [Deltaproteobacteria bacterium]